MRQATKQPADDACTSADAASLACWCQNGCWRRCFKTSRFGLLRCTSCGCYRIDPVPLSNDEEAADFYSEYYRDKTITQPLEQAPRSQVRTSRFWPVVEKVRDLERVQHAVADIGCGEGDLCRELLAAGWPVVAGLDVSRTRIARARVSCPDARFYDCSLDESEIAADSLDLVVLDNVIEHLRDPVKMLQQIRVRLAPGGRCVVMTPNMDSGNFHLLGRRWTPELAPHTHIFLFTEESLGQALRQAGFEVQTSGCFHPTRFSWRDWLSIIRSSSLKESGWWIMQESGSLWARLTRRAPMLYAVGAKS